MSTLTFWIITALTIAFAIYMIAKAIELLTDNDIDSNPLDLLVKGLSSTRLITMFLSFIATVITAIIWTNYILDSNPDWDYSKKIILYLDMVSLGIVISFFLAVVLIKAEQNLGKSLEKSKKSWVITIVVIYSVLDFSTLVFGGIGFKENFIRKETSKLEQHIAHMKNNGVNQTQLVKSLSDRIKEINNIISNKNYNLEDTQTKYYRDRIEMWKQKAYNNTSKESTKNTYLRYADINKKKLAKYLTEKRTRLLDKLYKERTELFKQLDILQKSADERTKDIQRIKEKTIQEIVAKADKSFESIILIALGIVLINILLGYITGKLMDEDIDMKPVKKVKEKMMQEPLEDKIETVQEEEIKPIKFTEDDKLEFIKKAMLKIIDEKNIMLSPYESYKPSEYFTRDRVMEVAREIAIEETKQHLPLSAPKVMTVIREQHRIPYQYIHEEVEQYIRDRSSKASQEGNFG